jgi:site-specific DNA recombinase
MLRNPYYMGVVVWNGQRYPGKHEPLVDQDTWDRVQMLLTASHVGGERAQKHEHYLRGTVVCAECLGRLLYGRHRGRSRYYEYFSCNNRTARRRGVACSSGHYAVERTEQRVLERVYRMLAIPKEVQEQIRAELRRELAERTALIEQEAERHERALAQIEAKQEKLVQLYYQDLVSEKVFAAEQEKLNDERRAARKLRKAAKAQIGDVQAALDLALSRVDRPYEAYREATPLERRVMNRAVFERIEIGPEGEITGTVLTPTYEALSAWQPGLGRPQGKNGSPSAEIQPYSGRIHYLASESRTRTSLSSGRDGPQAALDAGARRGRLTVDRQNRAVARGG